MFTFTYSPTDNTPKDRVRFHLQDTVIDAGPLPKDANFSDEEILALISAEGLWQRAVAAGLETLATAWRKYPNLESDQFGLSRSHISRGYAEDAAEWRKKWGYAGDPDPTIDRKNQARSVGYVRVDAWSDSEPVGEAER